MKKLGFLYGCDLLLDTDDVELARVAEQFLESNFKHKKLTDAELDAEVRAMLDSPYVQ